jgi:hypothetical protein
MQRHLKHVEEILLAFEESEPQPPDDDPAWQATAK